MATLRVDHHGRGALTPERPGNTHPFKLGVLSIEQDLIDDGAGGFIPGQVDAVFELLDPWRRSSAAVGEVFALWHLSKVDHQYRRTRVRLIGIHEADRIGGGTELAWAVLDEPMADDEAREGFVLRLGATPDEP